MKVWNNLLKFLPMRLSNGLRDTLHSGYRLWVCVLRKMSRRLVRLSWLKTLINHIFPCPQIVRRYIDPALGIEEFFTILNRRGVQYTVLRWFEDLPELRAGDGIDMLVRDDDLSKIKDLFVVLPTGTLCDVYSVSALRGASYRNHVPLYPAHLARDIIETSVLYKDIYRVPDLRHHLLSLAYHAVYHKAEESGLASSKDDPAGNSNGERSYANTLVTLGKRLGVKILPDLQSLRELLIEQGWAPRIDVLRRIAEGSPSLCTLLTDISTGQLLPKESTRYALDVHGVRVFVESNCPTFLEYVRRDFCFFHNLKADHGAPHVRVMFLNANPPWEEIPSSAVPLFKTAGSTVYQHGTNRYVDHDREVLAIYDLDRDEGTVFSTDPAAMYRVAYSMLMTRIGLRLDATRLHRINAFAVSLNDVALLFLGPGGCGKTTLGFELMKQPQVRWLSDDIVPIDSNNRALPFPTSPRLIEGNTVPWLSPTISLLKSPWPKDPPKVQLPSWFILSRVSASAQLGALFLCSRRSDIAAASIKPVGFFEAFLILCENALTGNRFALMKAYQCDFSLTSIMKMALVYIYRVQMFIRLAWTVTVFRFDMGEQVSENASFLLNTWTVMRQHLDRDRSSLDAASAISLVEGRNFGSNRDPTNRPKC